MVGAQAFLMDNNYESDYGMNSYNGKQSYGKDNNYYKSKDSSNVKCNNINVNVNGFNGVTLPTALNGLTTDEGQASSDEGDVGANSFESDSGGIDGGKPSGSDTDSRFVCINNNNNVVEEEEEPPTCEECFGSNTRLQAVIKDFIVSRDDDFIFNIPNGEFLELRFEIDTIEQLCALLEGTELHSVPLTDVLLEHVLTEIVRIQTGSTLALQTEIDALIECLLEAGVVIEATV